LQSGKCLHCNQFLCIRHIVEHGKAVWHSAEHLYQEVNELAQQVMIISKSVHIMYDNVEAEWKAWRAKAFETIEETFAEGMRSIGSKRDSFTRREELLALQLNEKIRQPLQRMKEQQSANLTTVKTVQLEIGRFNYVISVFQRPPKPFLNLPM
jgi:ABC-type uncharacterized transport system ATPase subunit